MFEVVVEEGESDLFDNVELRQLVCVGRQVLCAGEGEEELGSRRDSVVRICVTGRIDRVGAALRQQRRGGQRRGT